MTSPSGELATPAPDRPAKTLPRPVPPTRGASFRSAMRIAGAGQPITDTHVPAPAKPSTTITLIDLSHDIPNTNIDMLAFRNRLLVRKDLHPALQYLLLEAMREVHWAPGPFNALGEFPAEQPNDLSLSPTAQAFYRSDPPLWQKYISFWLSSLLNRIAFFVIPVLVTLIPVIGLGLSFYRSFCLHRTIPSKRGVP
jgi:hypothetical protein